MMEGHILPSQKGAILRSMTPRGIPYQDNGHEVVHSFSVTWVKSWAIDVEMFVFQHAQ